MEELLYTIKKSGRDNYLVTEPDRIPLFEMEYLNRRTIRRNLPLEIAVQGGVTEFWYRLTGCVSLRTMLELKLFGEAELTSLMKEVYLFSKELERNMLNPLGVLLNLDAIFYKEGKNFLFCYHPSMEEELKVGLLSIVEELLTLADYKNQNMVKQLYFIYECLNQENPNYEELQCCPQEVLQETEAPKVCEGSITIEECFESEEVIMESEPKFYQLILREKERVEEKIKIILEGLRRKTKKKWEIYTDLKPVIIRPETTTESPTVFLGTQEKTGGVYCLMEEGETEDKRILLKKENIILGKNSDTADEIIEDESVSRLHAFITKEEGNYYLEDLNSLNGTFLNGVRLAYKEKVCLKENDMIGIGRKTFCFCSL